MRSESNILTNMGKRIQKHSWSLYFQDQQLIVNKLDNSELNRVIRLLKNEELTNAFYFDPGSAQWMKIEAAKADRRPIEIQKMDLPVDAEATVVVAPAKAAPKPAPAPQVAKPAPLPPKPAPQPVKPPAPQPKAPPPPPEIIVEIQGQKLVFKVAENNWPILKTTPPIISKKELDCIVEIPGKGVYVGSLKHIPNAPKPNYCLIEIKSKKS